LQRGCDPDHSGAENDNTSHGCDHLCTRQRPVAKPSFNQVFL
jgi:hypothetical protein